MNQGNQISSIGER